MRDFYNDLGVSRTASLDNIKRVYRQTVLTCHPDLNPHNPVAEENFKKITAAYV